MLTVDKLTDHILMDNVSIGQEEQDSSRYVPRIEGMDLSKNFEFTSETFSMVHDKFQCQIENQFVECDIEDYNRTLNLNKQIITYLLDLKKHITSALVTCEKKLTTVETNLRNHQTNGDAKIAIYNAGIPYFKDRDYFYAPNNEDETYKEAQKELQIRNLPKVCSWSSKERNILFKAVQDEAIIGALDTQSIERIQRDSVTSKPATKRRKITKTQFPPRDTKQMIESFRQKEFNWFKISNMYFKDIHSPLDCCVMWNVFLHPDVNKSCWTRSEDARLKELTKKYRYQNWDEIAKELDTNRTAYQCFIRYNTTKKYPKPRNCVWENKEDKRLLKLVEVYKIGDFIPWGELACWMRNRTKQQVYFRWTYNIAPNLTKGRFSKIEDDILKDAIVKYGTNFRKISAALIPNRSTVQLHDRYQTLTTNQMKNWREWTLAEDSKLLELFKCYGPNWSKIAKTFSCKTRTQLRHRYAALQKYSKKGISIFDLNRTRLENENEEQYQVPDDNLEHNVPNDDVDKELLEYFHAECASKRFDRKRNVYTVADEARHRVTNLYRTLQSLNAKISIPNDMTDLRVNKETRRFLCSLRNYVNTKNDEQRYLEVLDKCSTRMFGKNYAVVDEGPHFVPPLPFDTRMKFKKSIESQCIDYNLNRNSIFLAEKPKNFATPDYVISQIGGNEQELQFQKISRLLEFQGSKEFERNTQNLSTFPIKLFSRRSGSNGNNNRNRSGNALQKQRWQSAVGSESITDNCRDDRECVTLHANQNSSKLFTMFENLQHVVPVVCSTETTFKEKDTIEAAHATLTSFKNLTYLKHWEERRIDPNHVRSSMRSKTFRESFDLLETRLVQLLKYPIVLSKTALPEVYVMDTFSYDDVTSSPRIEKITTYHKRR